MTEEEIKELQAKLEEQQRILEEKEALIKQKDAELSTKKDIKDDEVVISKEELEKLKKQPNPKDEKIDDKVEPIIPDEVRELIEHNKKQAEQQITSKQVTISSKFKGVDVSAVKDINMLELFEKNIEVAVEAEKNKKLTQEEVAKFLKENPTLQAVILGSVTAELNKKEETTHKVITNKINSFLMKK